jgi:hypothetical protein
MFSKRFGISLLLAMSPALAQVSSGPAATPDQATLSPRQHAPRRAYGLTSERVVDNVTVSDSTNWERLRGYRLLVYPGQGLVDRSLRQLQHHAEHLRVILGGARRMDLQHGGADGNGFRL